jgi:hypothetical protein
LTTVPGHPELQPTNPKYPKSKKPKTATERVTRRASHDNRLVGRVKAGLDAMAGFGAETRKT